MTCDLSALPRQSSRLSHIVQYHMTDPFGSVGKLAHPDRVLGYYHEISAVVKVLSNLAAEETTRRLL